jgi:hypothetical protein
MRARLLMISVIGANEHFTNMFILCYFLVETPLEQRKNKEISKDLNPIGKFSMVSLEYRIRPSKFYGIASSSQILKGF